MTTARTARTTQSEHNDELGRLVVRVRHMIWHAAARVLTARGDSIHAWVVISHLVRLGPETQTDLACATLQHATLLSRLLDDLQERGLVRRVRDARDRRRMRVEVTARGRRWYEQRYPEVWRAVDAVLEPLGASEKQELRRLLGKVIAAGDAGDGGRD